MFKKNKIKYRNKKIVRAWLSQQEVAEYWYAADDDSFWAKFWKKMKSTFGGKTRPVKKLKSVIWSPFRGDKLYPFFEGEKLVAFSREYKKTVDDKEVVSFMTNFFPLLKLVGEVNGFAGSMKGRIVELEGEGADARYLTWSQVPDTVRFEAENLTNMAYVLTETRNTVISAI